MEIDLMHGDCLEKMKLIRNSSVDLILCDPPYGTIKGMNLGLNDLYKNKTIWDNVINLDEMWKHINRILRVSGICILFGQEPFSNSLINSNPSNLKFCYRAIWEKNKFGNGLNRYKALLNFYEDILIFTKIDDYEKIHPLRSYSEEIFNYINKSKKEINKDLGNRKAEHFFYFNSSQFELCTIETYKKLIELYDLNKLKGFIEYKELKNIDNDYKKKYGKTFNLWECKSFKSNIFKYSKESKSLHPTQKPVALLEDLIKTYSNENDTVLDFTMGSGSTGVACKNTNRNFIGIELSEEYFNIAKERIHSLKY